MDDLHLIGIIVAGMLVLAFLYDTLFCLAIGYFIYKEEKIAESSKKKAREKDPTTKVTGPN